MCIQSSEKRIWEIYEKAMGNVWEQHTVRGWNKDRGRASERNRERETARIQISEGKLLPFTGIIWDFQSDVIAEYVGCARRNRRSAMAVQLTTENTEVAPCLSLDPSHDPAHYGPTDILEAVC